jgi:phospholipid transport system substrate-binding protein
MIAEMLRSALLHLAGPLGLALATAVVFSVWPLRAPRWRGKIGGLLAIAAGTGLALGSAGPAWAGAPTEQLRAAVDRVLSIVEDPVLRQAGRTEERRTAIRGVAADIFDFTEITRRALGPHWGSGTPQQRAELVRLFTGLLERAYVGRIESYSGERVAWLGDTSDGGAATVRTRIVTKAGTEIPVDYRMYRRNGRWLAYDVMIEGVSLVANYRTQFNKIIQTSSHAGLVAALQAKQ